MKFVWRGDRVHGFQDDVEPIERIKGYRYSLGAFTGLTGFWEESRGRWGLSFFEMHLDRILQTAEFLQLEHGMSRDELRRAVFEVIRFNKPTDPFYVHIGRTMTGNPRAHGVEEFDQVHNLRFTCRVVDTCEAIREASRHDDVLRARHGNQIKRELGPLEAVFCGSAHITVHNIDPGP